MGLMNLFRPKWKHSDPAVRRAAVSELQDQDTLIKVARNDEDLHARKAAVEKINSETVLAIIATNDEDPSVRQAACKRQESLRGLIEIN